MTCTRLYVDPIEAPMGQEREKRNLGLLKQWWENMRGHNILLIIITPKDKKQASKNIKTKHLGNWIWRAFLSTLCYHRSVPSPLLGRIISILPPPYLQTLPHPSSVQPPPSLFGIGPMMMTIIVISPTPPTMRMQTRRAVAVLATKRRYLYPTNLTNSVQDMESSP